MKLTKIEPKYLKKYNPRIGLITLASDFRIEKDFNSVIYGKDIDLYCNRIKCYNPLTNEMLKKMADDIPKVTKDILPDQQLDCVAYGCTSGTIAAGYQSIHEKVNLAKPNTKVTTPITSTINALKSLKIKKLARLKIWIFSVSAYSNPIITSSTHDPCCAFKGIKVTFSVDHKDWSPSHRLILLGISL